MRRNYDRDCWLFLWLKVPLIMLLNSDSRDWQGWFVVQINDILIVIIISYYCIMMSHWMIPLSVEYAIWNGLSMTWDMKMHELYWHADDVDGMLLFGKLLFWLFHDNTMSDCKQCSEYLHRHSFLSHVIDKRNRDWHNHLIKNFLKRHDVCACI